MQKPRAVIDAISNFLENDYANVHRGAYDLSERSENLYGQSKKAVAGLINAEFSSEIAYTYNSTYALNLLSLSMAKSGWLKAGDRVLLSVAEHHANLVPWLMLKEWFGVEVDFFGMTPGYGIDFADFEAKMTPKTRVVAATYASNVTGSVFDLPRLGRMISKMADQDGKKPLFVVDARQAVPNFKTDVRAIGADFAFFTGHKMMADTGIGVLYGRKELLKSLSPAISGGAAINWVTKDSFAAAGLPLRFEPGTPNLSGAVSLLAAIGYFESVGGYERLKAVETPLIEAALRGFASFGDRIELFGPKTAENRVGIFSFNIRGAHVTDVAEAFAANDVCVRSGFHCAEPLAIELGIDGSVRMSLYLYNDETELDAFFRVVQSLVTA